jgi:3-oxoadipate enol-lactonase
MWDERIATVTAHGTEAIADAVMGRYFHDGFRAAQEPTMARFRRRVASTGAAGYAVCCAAVAGIDTGSRLAQIAVSALVIADASHLSAIEQPERFAALVQEFKREQYA